VEAESGRGGQRLLRANWMEETMSLAAYLRQMPRLVEAGIASQRRVLDPAAAQLQEWLRALVAQGGPPARAGKDALHGTWLGHALHPALTDVPIGAWSVGLLLDLGNARQVADRVITIGVVSAVPTALAGLADWTETEDKQRRTGLVHALLNTIALGLYVGSLVARRRGNRAFGVGLSTAGFAVVLGSAYLGGELVYAQGTAVSRNAWSPDPEEFQVAARESDLAEGTLTRGEITLNGAKVPLVLLRRDGAVVALHGVCSHWGAPLADGKLVMDGTAVECPWHQSTFSLRDGTVLHGPAATPQPRFQTRIRDGNVEVRRAE
jgi:nitrite reductase/ring-hydroxylating ferredoxin subunit/uncharacterized membrane protein